jgi:CHASE3 domain sensor protein
MAAFKIRRSFRILAPGSSMRRRVALSLAIVRLVLAPVIVLAVYYLFQIGRIVDRIVSYDAPAATLAQQASIEMLDARRAERNYLLVYDPASLKANGAALDQLDSLFAGLRDIHPSDNDLTQPAMDALYNYRQRFEEAAAIAAHEAQSPGQRIYAVVVSYERDLETLLKGSRTKTRAQLIDALRDSVDSFDAQISKTAQESNPALKEIGDDLQKSGERVLELASQLEGRNWRRIEDDHHRASRLISQAEWALSIVSAITFLVSVWISFTLPKQVVQPLLSLKDAVDHAAAGNYEIDFEISGEGELAGLANSIRNLITHVRERYEWHGAPQPPAAA